MLSLNIVLSHVSYSVCVCTQPQKSRQETNSTVYRPKVGGLGREPCLKASEIVHLLWAHLHTTIQTYEADGKYNEG